MNDLSLFLSGASAGGLFIMSGSFLAVWKFVLEQEKSIKTEVARALKILRETNESFEKTTREASIANQSHADKLIRMQSQLTKVEERLSFMGGMKR